MIQVAGGTYLERCAEVSWDELMGSGLRAAAALRAISDRVVLHTYIGRNERGTLEAYASVYGLEVKENHSAQTLQFTYSHGLARPWIDPPLHLLEQAPPIRFEGESVLRFGMLEGDAVVRGQRVVYDPQSAHDPRPFHENGSQAERLAIVVNQREAAALTGEPDLDKAGEALLELDAAEVALIKRGASGVRVFHGGTHTDVPAYRTERIFPIGSGDVFSAVFAHHWAETGVEPQAAADLASRATAWYCQNGGMPFPFASEIESAVNRPISPRASVGTTRRVYLAGPFFTMAERWLVNEARTALLKQGVTVFSPFHDVGVGSAHDVVPKDIEELNSVDAVFAIVDRLDAGTLFEVGYARAKGVPVVAFVESEPEEPLKMLVGTECEIVTDFVSGIYRATWAALER